MGSPPPGRDSFGYHLFGLAIASEIELPELEPQGIGPGEKRDLTISLGKGDASRGGFDLDIPGVARFIIRAGRSIVVDPAPRAGEREMRLYLLGSAMGVALHQRGILPLHANAVELDGRAIAFMGHSGSGKSTLAAWFHDHGMRILADDVCVVRTDGAGEPLAFPGLPRLRLWQDALEASGRAPDEHSLSFHPEGDERRKFDVAIPPTGRAEAAMPLAALFLLEQGPHFAIDRLAGSTAVEAISANTYRGGYIAEVADSARHLEACIALARAVPVFRLSRPFDRASFDRQCHAIVEHCRSYRASG